jgi:peptidyl-prolyl cis-trans isomerase C
MGRPRLVVLVVATAACVALGGAARGDDAGAGGRRSTVVARIGSITVTVGEIEDRIAAMPPFQRASFGATADAVRKRFLNDVVVHDAVLTAGAQGLDLGDKPPAAYEIERARSAATIRAIRTRIGPASSIPMEEVEQYFQTNRARYDAPTRYQLWRILCKTRDEAQTVLTAAEREPTPATFANLAREHSLDKATNLRSGNLGFVTAEGGSNEPGLRIDPAVVHAAQGVRDGAFVPEPIAEGEYFAVIWRRGTIAATTRSEADVAPQIRDWLWKSRVKKETDALLATLRAERVHDVNAAILSTLDLPVERTAKIGQ